MSISKSSEGSNDAKLEKIFGKSTLPYFWLTEELLSHSKLKEIFDFFMLDKAIYEFLSSINH
jgi:hypothetical protein